MVHTTASPSLHAVRNATTISGRQGAAVAAAAAASVQQQQQQQPYVVQHDVEAQQMRQQQQLLRRAHVTSASSTALSMRYHRAMHSDVYAGLGSSGGGNAVFAAAAAATTASSSTATASAVASCHPYYEQPPQQQQQHAAVGGSVIAASASATAAVAAHTSHASALARRGEVHGGGGGSRGVMGVNYEQRMSQQQQQHGTSDALSTTTAAAAMSVPVRDALQRPVVALSLAIMRTYNGINLKFDKDESRRHCLRGPKYNNNNSNSSATHGNSSNNVLVAAGGSSHHHHHGYDDAAGYYIPVIGHVIAQRYTVQAMLGRGSFGVALRCRDEKHGDVVAVKVIRSGAYFEAQGVFEARVVAHLNRNPDLANLVVRLRETLVWHGHVVLVFELLSFNLYELIKCTRHNGFSLDLVRKFAYQLVHTLLQLELHQPPIIHCDLKPENIMLKNQSRSGIRVIDFGSACFQTNTVVVVDNNNNNNSNSNSNNNNNNTTTSAPAAAAVALPTYIQSRYYRSPEVILELGYTTAIDRWSLGCVLVEVHTGEPLFKGSNEADMLTRFTAVLGPLPSHMIARSPKRHAFYATSYRANTRHVASEDNSEAAEVRVSNNNVDDDDDDGKGDDDDTRHDSNALSNGNTVNDAVTHASDDKDGKDTQLHKQQQQPLAAHNSSRHQRRANTAYDHAAAAAAARATATTRQTTTATSAAPLWCAASAAVSHTGDNSNSSSSVLHEAMTKQQQQLSNSSMPPSSVGVASAVSVPPPLQQQLHHACASPNAAATTATAAVATASMCDECSKDNMAATDAVAADGRGSSNNSSNNHACVHAVYTLHRPPDPATVQSLAAVLGVYSGGPRGCRRGQEGHDVAAYLVFLDFVQRLLAYDPHERLGCAEALRHPFLLPVVQLEASIAAQQQQQQQQAAAAALPLRRRGAEANE